MCTAVHTILAFPQVCMDETNKQLLGEVRPPSGAAGPSRPHRQRVPTTRHGQPLPVLRAAAWLATGEGHRTANQSRLGGSDPGAGRRPVSGGRTDRAGHGQPQYPHSRVALRGLRTGRSQAPSGQARHPSHPKHGSWLNIAEIELSVLARQCLDRRIDSLATLTHEVAAWQADQNASQRGVDWRFSTADARVKLKRLYPSRLT